MPNGRSRRWLPRQIDIDQVSDEEIQDLVITANLTAENAWSRRLDAARAWPAERNDCTARTGVIGFCMVGGPALMLGADHAFSVASVNYHQIPNARCPRASPIVASVKDH
jgi:dienelactone hydrolase